MRYFIIYYLPSWRRNISGEVIRTVLAITARAVARPVGRQ
jgi:hypothetical protein